MTSNECLIMTTSPGNNVTSTSVWLNSGGVMYNNEKDFSFLNNTENVEEPNRMDEAIQSLENSLDKLSDQLKEHFRRLVISQINLLKYKNSHPRNFDDVKLNNLRQEDTYSKTYKNEWNSRRIDQADLDSNKEEAQKEIFAKILKKHRLRTQFLEHTSDKPYAGNRLGTRPLKVIKHQDETFDSDCSEESRELEYTYNERISKSSAADNTLNNKETYISSVKSGTSKELADFEKKNGIELRASHMRYSQNNIRHGKGSTDMSPIRSQDGRNRERFTETGHRKPSTRYVHFQDTSDEPYRPAYINTQQAVNRYRWTEERMPNFGSPSKRLVPEISTPSIAPRAGYDCSPSKFDYSSLKPNADTLYEEINKDNGIYTDRRCYTSTQDTGAAPMTRPVPLSEPVKQTDASDLDRGYAGYGRNRSVSQSIPVNSHGSPKEVKTPQDGLVHHSTGYTYPDTTSSVGVDDTDGSYKGRLMPYQHDIKAGDKRQPELPNSLNDSGYMPSDRNTYLRQEEKQTTRATDYEQYNRVSDAMSSKVNSGRSPNLVKHPQGRHIDHTREYRNPDTILRSHKDNGFMSPRIDRAIREDEPHTADKNSPIELTKSYGRVSPEWNKSHIDRKVNFSNAANREKTQSRQPDTCRDGRNSRIKNESNADKHQYSLVEARHEKPSEQENTSVYKCQNDRPLSIDCKTRITSPTCKQLENCVFTTTVTVNSDTGEAAAEPDINNERVSDDNPPENPEESTFTDNVEINLPHGSTSGADVPETPKSFDTGSPRHGSRDRDAGLLVQWQTSSSGRSSPLDLSYQPAGTRNDDAKADDDIDKPALKKDITDYVVGKEVRMHPTEEIVMSGAVPNIPAKASTRTKCNAGRDIPSDVTKHLELLVSLLRETTEAVDQADGGTRGIFKFRDLLSRTGALEKQLMYVTARVEDNDSAVDDDVRREVSDITASLTQIDPRITDLHMIINKLLQAGVKLGHLNRETALVPSLYHFSNQLRALLELLLSRAERPADGADRGLAPMTNGPESSDHTTSRDHVKREDPEPAAPLTMPLRTKGNIFAVPEKFLPLTKEQNKPIILREEGRNRITPLHVQGLKVAYRELVVCFLLGLVTGIVLSCSWSTLTGFLGDFIIGISLYLWCSVRLIHQYPPIV